MLRCYAADLHVHTALSPCAAPEMTPPLIVQRALEQGLNLIAITDHNASANVGAVQRAAGGTGLTVLPGMELQTSEEIHLLCLFDTEAEALAWQEEVAGRLSREENRPEIFGEQLVLDESGRLLRHEKRLLACSTQLRLVEAAEAVRLRGGLAIPAHVDRPSFSLTASLGFPPADLAVDALEISAHTTATAACRQFPWLADFPLVQGGDVHQPEDFSPATTFLTLAAPTLVEIRLAFRGDDARSCCIIPR